MGYIIFASQRAERDRNALGGNKSKPMTKHCIIGRENSEFISSSQSVCVLSACAFLWATRVASNSSSSSSNCGMSLAVGFSICCGDLVAKDSMSTSISISLPLSLSLFTILRRRAFQCSDKKIVSFSLCLSNGPFLSISLALTLRVENGKMNAIKIVTLRVTL